MNNLTCLVFLTCIIILIEVIENRCVGVDTYDKHLWPGKVQNITVNCMKINWNEVNIAVNWSAPQEQTNASITGYEVVFVFDNEPFFHCKYTNNATTGYMIRSKQRKDAIEIAVTARPILNDISTNLIYLAFSDCTDKSQTVIVK